MSPYSPGRRLRQRLVREIQSIFHDADRNERPVVRSREGYYGSTSVIWRVHGDVTAMMVGGVTALLLQMLHPSALAGIWDHSTFRDDLLGRLRRTARFIAVTTFADQSAANHAIAQVRDIHCQIRGELDDGTTYSATAPRLLAWVHACEAIAFLDA